MYWCLVTPQQEGGRQCQYPLQEGLQQEPGGTKQKCVGGQLPLVSDMLMVPAPP